MIRKVPPLPENVRGIAKEKIDDCFASGTIQMFEHEVGDGGWAAARIVPLPPAGASNTVMIISTDITERKRAEEELKKYRDHLEELVNERTAQLNRKNEELNVAKEHAENADRIKSIFLLTMSHELRTPLNSIIGFTGIISDGLSGPINDEQKKQLDMVKNSGNHLLSLINDVLDISKIEAGQFKTDIAPFEMTKAIEAVVQIMMPLANTKGLAMHVEMASQLGVIVSDKACGADTIKPALQCDQVHRKRRGQIRMPCQCRSGNNACI